MSKSGINFTQVDVSGNNIGTGEGTYAYSAPFNTLNFKSLVGAGNLSIISGTTEITISGGTGADGVVNSATLTGTTVLTLGRTEGLPNVIVELSSLVTSPSGSDGQIQFNNAGAFGGDNNFTFSASTNSLTLGSRVGVAGLNTLTVGDNACATVCNSFSVGDNTKAIARESFAQGASSSAGGRASVALINAIVSCDFSLGAGNGTRVYSLNSTAIGNNAIAGSSGTAINNSIAIGYFVCSEGLGSFAGGLGCSTKRIRALGDGSFNHSTNNSNQGANTCGALADGSAILGGLNHNIESGNTNAAIIGGTCINLTGVDYIDTTAVSNLAIISGLTSGSSDQILIKNISTGIIEYVSKASLGGGGGITTANNGLTVDGSNIRLGGTLTGDTVINTSNSHGIGFGYNVNAIGSNSFAQGRNTCASGIDSHAEGFATSATTSTAHSEGQQTCASGVASHAEGNLTTASGCFSHAEGCNTQATGKQSHAEGHNTLGFGNCSHAEGWNTFACGDNSHSEGEGTFTYGINSHSQNSRTKACGIASHAGGHGASSGKYSTAQGDGTFIHSHNTITGQTIGHGALADFSAILGGTDHNIEVGNTGATIIGGNTIKLTGTDYINTTAVDHLAIITEPTSGSSDQVLIRNISTGVLEYVSKASLGGGGSTSPAGADTQIQFNNAGVFGGDSQFTFSAATNSITLGSRAVGSSGGISSSQGFNNIASGYGSFAQGNGNCVTANWSHVIGGSNKALASYTHAEGRFSHACGISSHAEGGSTCAIGDYSHSEGNQTKTYGNRSHAEGFSSHACGEASHVEGCNNIASGHSSHAEGSCSIAYGARSHAEGYCSCAIGTCSHAEGRLSCAIGASSHAEGCGGIAIGQYSHAEGDCTTATGVASHAEGYKSYAIGSRSHTQGAQVEARGNASHVGGSGFVDKCILTCGCTAFNHSRNTLSQTIGHGASADQSSILGGCDHDIAIGNLRAAIIGGDTIKLTSNTYIDTTAMSCVAIFKTPATGGADDVLTWNASTKKIGKQTQATVAAASDAELKTKLEPLSNVLEGVITLEPYEYEFNEKMYPEHIRGQRRYGLIAQDVEKIYPTIVEDKIKINDVDYKGIRYIELVPILVQAIKELKIENNKLNERLEILENK